MNLVWQVILVIFRNILVLVILVISGIFIDSCESDGSGDSGAYGHSCDSGDSIESAYSCESELDKNGFSVDSVGSGISGKSGNSCESSDNGEFRD